MATLMSRLLRLARRREAQQAWIRKCHSNNEQTKQNLLGAYVQKVLDNPLPLGAGALVVGLIQWKRIRERNQAQLENSVEEKKGLEETDWQVACYKTLPLRHISRLWGTINDIYLPRWTRKTILGGYAKAFGCDVSEAEIDDIAQYSNLGEFFRRKLKGSARPISGEDLVSPCDGKVLHYGEVDVQSGLVEQVKGVTYSLTSFLGSYFTTPPHALPGTLDNNQLDDVPKTLHQCVIYLAPGDYHCFHSPVDWTVKQRRHFPGELLSVNPKVVGLISKLFQLNERVAYLGEWKHGFFSMTAVGATNVGSIKVPVDVELSTNQWKWESKTFHQKDFKDAVTVKKGDYFGEFNLGSTIVLIFEAPKDFKFDLSPDMPVKVGIPIQSIPATSTQM